MLVIGEDHSLLNHPKSSREDSLARLEDTLLIVHTNTYRE